MEKVATQIFESIGKYLKDNPNVLTNALAGGALGGLGGLVLPTGGPDDEPMSKKNKRRIQNALVLGTMGAGAGGLLTHGLKNTAEIITAPTSKDMTMWNNVAEVVGSPLSGILSPLAGIGGYHVVAGKFSKGRQQAVELIRSLLGNPKGNKANLQDIITDAYRTMRPKFGRIGVTFTPEESFVAKSLVGPDKKLFNKHLFRAGMHNGSLGSRLRLWAGKGGQRGILPALFSLAPYFIANYSQAGSAAPAPAPAPTK